MKNSISYILIFVLGLILLNCQPKNNTSTSKSGNDTTEIVNNNIYIPGLSHLSFMGIPIDGTVESFSEKLKAKGFYQKYEYSSNVFTGQFVHTYADVTIMYEPRNNVVYAVEVEIPEYTDTKLDYWERLSNKYDENVFKAKNDVGDYIIVFPRDSDVHVDINDFETIGNTITLESRSNNKLVITYEDWWNSNYNHQALEDMDL